MSTALLVPIHLDVLCLAKNDKKIAREMTDYTLLPYKFDGGTHAENSPNLSEEVYNTDGTTILTRGIHLHWALPDALTNGVHTQEGTTFPVVPNRWLIIRQLNGQPDKKWVVESDYLYPTTAAAADRDTAPTAINILIEPPPIAAVDADDASTYQYQRYRYMGRCWELGEWSEDQDAKEHAATLTAIGNLATVPIFDEVKATFAAFYPNCSSVFGFHDPDYPDSGNSPPEGLQYDVVGWYEDAGQDCLARLMSKESIISPATLLEKLQEEMGWTLEELPETFPERTMYHARVTFQAPTQAGGEKAQVPIPEVAVASSAPNAIAAYLGYSFVNPEAHEVGENQAVRKAVEEKITALQIAERLESRKLDVKAKFREGHHEEGFSARTGGLLWTIKAQFPPKSNDQRQTRRNLRKSQQPPLPDELAEQLNQLNIIQEKYNQIWLDITSLRKQLYCQWNLTISERQDKNYATLYDVLLKELRTRIAQAGKIDFNVDNQGQFALTVSPLQFNVSSRLDAARFSNDPEPFFTQHIEVMDSAVDGNFDDWNDYIQCEFNQCGILLSDECIVTKVSEDDREPAWQINDQGQCYEVKVEQGIFKIFLPVNATSFNENDGAVRSIAAQLFEALQALKEEILQRNNAEIQFSLHPFPSQNYWQANDPVVLLTGKAAQASTRFGQDGRLREDDLLACHVLDFDVSGIINNIEQLQVEIEALVPDSDEDSINFNVWQEQPWNPFAFNWLVHFYPYQDTTDQGYQPNHILKTYSLEKNEIDLQLRLEDIDSELNRNNSYTGFNILTPSVGIDLTERLTAYLLKEALPSYLQAEALDGEQTSEYLQEHWEAIRDWYSAEHSLSAGTQAAANDPVYVSLWAYGKMQELDCQAQMIGGFNDTLMLTQPTLHLEVDEPITNDGPSHLITEQVRWTLGSSLQYKVLDHDIFNPIRSGAMSIEALWLIDSFGQRRKVLDASDNSVITTCAMTSGRDRSQVLLPPRLAQFARLNFHWLAAEAEPNNNAVEMTAKPLKTPVCGWLIPNNLDSSLAVCDRTGQSLGSIDVRGHWRTAPGKSLSLDERGCPILSNSHLQKLVHYLLTQGEGFQQQFISTIDNSLENIDPDSYTQHPSLVMLVGRPVAVVRATFSLEVQGLPARNPKTVITEDNYESPDTKGFTEVQFPIRLGDYQQLNDGLIGYWREMPGENGCYDYEGDVFYATQSNLTGDGTDLIQTEAEGINHFEQTVDAEPQGVTMLIDPRGVVHATCGILPNQELRLPPESYADALQAIEVNFLTAPILSDQPFEFEQPIEDQGAVTLPQVFTQGVALPLPQESGLSWSWVSMNGEEWTESTAIEPVNLKAVFSRPQKIYEGWLQVKRESANKP